MTNPTVAELAAGLSEAQRRAILVALPCWFAGHSVGLRNGNTLSVLADKGFLERRSDPNTWGRSQYRFLPLGLEVRDHLKSQENPHVD